MKNFALTRLLGCIFIFASFFILLSILFNSCRTDKKLLATESISSRIAEKELYLAYEKKREEFHKTINDMNLNTWSNHLKDELSSIGQKIEELTLLAGTESLKDELEKVEHYTLVEKDLPREAVEEIINSLTKAHASSDVEEQVAHIQEAKNQINKIINAPDFKRIAKTYAASQKEVAGVSFSDINSALNTDIKIVDKVRKEVEDLIDEVGEGQAINDLGKELNLYSSLLASPAETALENELSKLVESDCASKLISEDVYKLIYSKSVDWNNIKKLVKEGLDNCNDKTNPDKILEKLKQSILAIEAVAKYKEPLVDVADGLRKVKTAKTDEEREAAAKVFQQNAEAAAKKLEDDIEKTKNNIERLKREIFLKEKKIGSLDNQMEKKKCPKCECNGAFPRFASVPDGICNKLCEEKCKEIAALIKKQEELQQQKTKLSWLSILKVFLGLALIAVGAVLIAYGQGLSGAAIIVVGVSLLSGGSGAGGNGEGQGGGSDGVVSEYETDGQERKSGNTQETADDKSWREASNAQEEANKKLGEAANAQEEANKKLGEAIKQPGEARKNALSEAGKKQEEANKTWGEATKKQEMANQVWGTAGQKQKEANQFNGQEAVSPELTNMLNEADEAIGEATKKQEELKKAREDATGKQEAVNLAEKAAKQSTGVERKVANKDLEELKVVAEEALKEVAVKEIAEKKAKEEAVRKIEIAEKAKQEERIRLEKEPKEMNTEQVKRNKEAEKAFEEAAKKQEAVKKAVEDVAKKQEALNQAIVEAAKKRGKEQEMASKEVQEKLKEVDKEIAEAAKKQEELKKAKEAAIEKQKAANVNASKKIEPEISNETDLDIILPGKDWKTGRKIAQYQYFIKVKTGVEYLTRLPEGKISICGFDEAKSVVWGFDIMKVRFSSGLRKMSKDGDILAPEIKAVLDSGLIVSGETCDFDNQKKREECCNTSKAEVMAEFEKKKKEKPVQPKKEEEKEVEKIVDRNNHRQPKVVLDQLDSEKIPEINPNKDIRIEIQNEGQSVQKFKGIDGKTYYLTAIKNDAENYFVISLYENGTYKPVAKCPKYAEVRTKDGNILETVHIKQFCKNVELDLSGRGKGYLYAKSTDGFFITFPIVEFNITSEDDFPPILVGASDTTCVN